MNWKKQKGQFVMAHHKWIKSILDQMKEIKVGLKGYKYLDEALELCFLYCLALYQLFQLYGIWDHDTN